MIYLVVSALLFLGSVMALVLCSEMLDHVTAERQAAVRARQEADAAWQQAMDLWQEALAERKQWWEELDDLPGDEWKRS